MVEYIARQLEESVRSAINTFPVVAITGPRQSGKTTLLKQMFSGKYEYISFDDPLTRELANTDPELFLKENRQNVIFDEIQHVPSLLSYLKIAVDADRKRYGRFILTGSQQFQLIKNLSDSLAGRIALLNLLPLGMTEVLSITEIDKYPVACFVNASLRGMYPEVVVNPALDSRLWYSSYLQTYLERDVRNMSNIGDLAQFQRFIRLLAARCSQILNMSSLAKELGVSINTIKNWLTVLTAGFVIYLLPAWHTNLGKRIIKSPKVYFYDAGLVAYLTGITTKEQLLYGPMSGPLFENYVVQEIIKGLYHKGNQPTIYYLRTHNGLEVDMIIESGSKIIPIEIKAAMTLTKRMAKPIQQVQDIFSKVDFSDGIIVSMQGRNTPITRGVRAVPFGEFLESLD
jgi:predicted AAA+ superfamily ATPase